MNGQGFIAAARPKPAGSPLFVEMPKADMDAFVFLFQTDTFGLLILEEMVSGVFEIGVLAVRIHRRFLRLCTCGPLLNADIVTFVVRPTDQIGLHRGSNRGISVSDMC
jgi:hypothetical protein